MKNSLFILLCLFSLSLYSQGYTVTKIDSKYEINFLDEFADQWYLNILNLFLLH